MGKYSIRKITNCAVLLKLNMSNKLWALNLFLNLNKFQPQYSYKLYSYQKMQKYPWRGWFLIKLLHAFSEPCQTSKMELWRFLAINCFLKKLYLGCLIGFRIRLRLNYRLSINIFNKKESLIFVLTKLFQVF